MESKGAGIGGRGGSQSPGGEDAERTERAALILWSLGAWYKKQRDEDGGIGGSRRKRRRLRNKQLAGEERLYNPSNVSPYGVEDDSFSYDSSTSISIGSIFSRIKEAHTDADGSCTDFLQKTFDMVANTFLATMFLGLLLVLPVGMISTGLKYLGDCPIQPKIPVYLLVGGCFGFLKLLTLLFYQVRSRRLYQKIDDDEAVKNGGSGDATVYDDDDDEAGDLVAIGSSKFIDILLSTFLFAWFVAGNVWVFSIWPPLFHQTLDSPNGWCNRSAYLFALIQIIICYALIVLIAVLTLALIVAQKLWTSEGQA